LLISKRFIIIIILLLCLSFIFIVQIAHLLFMLQRSEQQDINSTCFSPEQLISASYNKHFAEFFKLPNSY